MDNTTINNIIQHLSQKDTNPMSVPEICDYLGDYDIENVSTTLDDMVKDGLLMRTPKKQKYTVPERLCICTSIT